MLYCIYSSKITIDMERYTEFLHKFEDLSGKYINSAALEKLKEEYKTVIHSRRIFESIIDIKTLLTILIKRGIVYYNNISVLKHIAQQFVKDKSVEELIADYDQWLRENPSTINNLYNHGKSSNLLNNSESNIHKICKTVHPCDIHHENMPNHESDEQCKESLLINASCININPAQFIDNSNIFSTITIKKCSERCKKKRYIIMFIVAFILLIMLISLIWILVKVSYQSTAIVPKADPVTETTAGQLGIKMPYYTSSSINMGFSSQSRFQFNQTHFYTTTPMPSAEKDKELRDLVISKVSRRIGSSWADVCRQLHLIEADIEEIEMKYFNATQRYEKMFKEAINLYFTESPPGWKNELMRALDLSRRRDLKEMVEGIINQHNS